MASSIKAVLRKKKNAQGLYPIAIRITKERRSNYIYIGHYIDIKHWDENKNNVRKSHPNSARLNNLILAKLAQASETAIDFDMRQKDVSSQKIKTEIKSPLAKISFQDLSQSYLDDLRSNNKLTRYASDKVRVNHLITFNKNAPLYFKNIDENFLRQFMSHLKKKGQSQRSIINNLVVIRTLYNRAIKLEIIDKKTYPFGYDKIKIKFPETKKTGLTKEEIIEIENLTDLKPQEHHVRNIWLFSFYLAGMRVGDLLKIKWSDIADGRLHYRMNKNSKLLSLKLPEKIIPILENYKNDMRFDDDFIFPEMKKADLKNPSDILAKTKTATKKFNKYLGSIATKAEIDKKLTMHIARHSFGNIAGDKIPIQMLQKLYRHSSITTTINYQQNFMHKETDDALDAVIDF